MPSVEMHGINIFLPTYKRVRNGKLGKCVNSFIRNVADPNAIKFTFLVHKDDEETVEDFRDAPATALRRGVEFEVLNHDIEGAHLGKFYNLIYRESKWKDDTGMAVSMIGDDMVCETPGWDTAVLAQLNDISGLGIVHCEDGLQHGRIAVNLFTSRRFIEITASGIFMPEDFAADFIDVVHTEVARRIGNERFLPWVMLRHEHASLGPQSGWDEATTRLRKAWNSDGVEAIVEAHIRRRVNNYMKFLDTVPK